MVPYLRCSRKSGIFSAAVAVLLFALPFALMVISCAQEVPSSSLPPLLQSVSANLKWVTAQLPQLNSVWGNVQWICFALFLILDIGKGNYARTLIYAVTTVVLYVVLLLVMVCGPFIADHAFRHSFDSAAWKAAAWKTAAGEHNDIRLRMVDDLLQRYHLVGMSRAQIIDLLGEPNSFESDQTKTEILYYLGPERGPISIDSEWLDIKFNADTVVSAIDRTD